MKQTIAEVVQESHEDHEGDREAAVIACAQSFCCDMAEPAAAVELFKRFGPGTFGLHEAMDRMHVQAHIVEEFVLNSPGVVLCEPAYKMVHLAVALLHQAYQELGEFDELKPELPDDHKG